MTKQPSTKKPSAGKTTTGAPTGSSATGATGTGGEALGLETFRPGHQELQGSEGAILEYGEPSQFHQLVPRRGAP